MRNILLSLTLILAGIPALQAQNFNEDFAALSARIETAENCHIVSSITVYESKKNRQKILSFGAELKKSESAYRSRMEDVELISNNDYIIMVDYEEKVVQIERSPEMSKADREFLKDFYALDSLAKTTENVQFISKDGDLSTYKISLEKGMIETMTVVINTAEKSLKRMEYEYNETYFPSGNYVVIEYSVFDLAWGMDKTIFDAADVVTRKGNDFVLKEKYKGFELLDLYE